MIKRARRLSKRLHRNQKRKFDNLPYSVHPEEVAQIILDNKKSKNINELISSAYLHDGIEDTTITYEQILKEFGHMVASIVLEVTNDPKLIEKYGKKEYLAYKLLTLTNYGLVVKLSDRLHNVSDLNLADEHFKKKYIDETKYIVQVLEDFRTLTPTQKKLIEKIKEKIWQQT